MERLLAILSLRRPHGSVGEQQLIEQHIERYQRLVFKDNTGEVMAYAISTDNTSKTLFTAHTDTVHNAADPTTHNLTGVNEKGDVLMATKGSVLGADDGAGVWLLLEMIDAGVPGTYLFLRGEERGGIGSNELARNYGDWLQQFDRAIAFDRKV